MRATYDVTDEPKKLQIYERTHAAPRSVRYLRTARILHKVPVRAWIVSNRSRFARTSMKFLPPEEEIRAQLRELTSKTRRLRADLTGLINDRGHSNSAFSRDHRLRPKPDRSPPAAQPSDQPAHPPQHELTESTRPKARRRRQVRSEP